MLCRGPLPRRLSLTLLFIINNAVKVPGALFELPIKNGDPLCRGQRAVGAHLRFHTTGSAGTRAILRASTFVGAAGVITRLAACPRVGAASLCDLGAFLRTITPRRTVFCAFALSVSAIILVECG